MSHPPLVCYESNAQYKAHFERHYCRVIIKTHDGIRIYFSSDQFSHAFYESSKRDGGKNVFSIIRAQRIDWIRSTLEHPDAKLFQGWNKIKKCYELNRRAAVKHENFIVIISIKRKPNDTLSGKFITCYQADNSIEKINKSPLWTIEKFMEKIGGGR